MDRGYDGFNMIESCNRLQDCYYVIRTKAGKFGGIREIANLPDREWPPDEMFVEMLTYTVPVRTGRSDKRNLKPKSAVWFVYRVA